jgi:hypothetical protein
MQTWAHVQSKYNLSNLALRSIVELERMNAGLDCDRAVFSDLASALRDTSGPSTAGLQQFRFVEPGYFEPFERLYRSASSSAEANVEQIQDYVNDVSSRLIAIASGPKVDGSLLPVCIALHQELVQELTAEDAFDVHERPLFSEEPTTGLCPA